MKWSLLSQVCCSLIEDAIDFSDIFLIASIINWGPTASGKLVEAQDAEIFIICLVEMLHWLLYTYLQALSGADEIRGVMAASHCYSWWRWWFDTLCSTLIKLCLWTHSCHVSFGLTRIFTMATTVLLWSFLCNLKVLSTKWVVCCLLL